MTETAIESPAIPDPRPLVARNLSNRAPWVFAALAALGGLALFAALEARRAEKVVDPLRPVQVAGDIMISPPPPLAIPEPQTPSSPGWPPYGAWPQSAPVAAPVLPARAAPTKPAGRSVAQSYMPPAPLPYYPMPAASPPPSGPMTVYQAPAVPQPAAMASEAPGKDNQRVKAGHFANPSMTVPQGAVIQAVLETALDSTRAGPARAIVSRDVSSFDGTRVLIPRGSRLYGEYKADLSSGQSRAMIQWTRLIRPDGVVIALDSPSADSLGRAGVGGKVNSHFFARFGNALLRTMLNVGVSYGTSQATGGTVVVGLPGAMTPAPVPQAENIRPTLKVAQGTPVSVFVSRDLDFSEVER